MGLNKPIRLLLTVLLTISGVSAFAQTQVSGHVYDSFGEPLIGASVMIKGTMQVLLLTLTEPTPFRRNLRMSSLQSILDSMQ